MGCYPPLGVFPQSWSPQGIFTKIIVFQAYSQDSQKTEKVTQGISKATPNRSKSNPEDTQVHSTTKNVKPDENHCIYKVFSTSRYRMRLRFPAPNHKKTTLEPMLQFSANKSEKSQNFIQTGSQEDPRIHEQIIKIQIWIPRCPARCPPGPQDRQNGVPGIENGSLNSPKFMF